MTDMRTPLGKVRGAGSAREGTGHFWMQRLTAIANIPLTLFFVGLLVSLNGTSHDHVRSVMTSPVTALLLLLAVVSVLFHMRLGMQVVIEDYVHGEGSKIALLMFNTFVTMILGAAMIFAILKLAFGG